MSYSVRPHGLTARQAPLSMGFSREEYWSGLPFPSPGDLPNPGIKPTFLASPVLTYSLPLCHLGSVIRAGFKYNLSMIRTWIIGSKGWDFANWFVHWHNEPSLCRIIYLHLWHMILQHFPPSVMLRLAAWFALASEMWAEVTVGQFGAKTIWEIVLSLYDLLCSCPLPQEVHATNNCWSKNDEGYMM